MHLYGYYLFALSFLYFEIAFGLPTGNDNDQKSVYDQRQNGKYNIHISLKDVAIVEVDRNEFIDDTINDSDEYYYDEDDLTIKPIASWIVYNSTTLKPTTLETDVLQLSSNNSSLDKVNTTGQNSNKKHNFTLQSSTAGLIAPNISALQKPVSHENQRSFQDNIKQIIYHPQRSDEHFKILNVASTQPRSTNCRRNYVADSHGNCFKRRRSPIMKYLFNMLKLMQRTGK